MLWLLLSAFPIQTIAQSTSDAQNATAFSLLYGYPLLAWQKAYVPVIDAVGTNSWHHFRELEDASDRAVVKPNVDTLYSSFVYDLSQSNVVITIPEVPAEELKLFSFYDPFGDDWLIIGTGGFYQPGQYLLRPYDRPGGSSQVGLQNSNASSGDYVATITSPTPYGILLTRWGINATNAAAVHGWQNGCGSKVLAMPKDATNATSPKLTSLVDVYNTHDSPATNVLNLLAKFAPSNGPSSQFQSAGISHGEYTAVPSVNLTAANATAVGMISAAATDPHDISPENNGWSVASPKYIGVYGTNYALRSLIAQTTYLALANPYAVYPTWANGSSGSAQAFLHVARDEAILFTFSGKPPLQAAGFWSLTAYGSDYYLIPNARNVYALGDRSNITYSDGTQVYGATSNESSSDKTYQLLIQPADVAPPANWTSNWLPAPSGGGDVVAQLRFYIAKKSLLDGSYQYPLVEKISAITGKQATTGGSVGESGAGSTISATSALPWITLLTTMVCFIGGTIAL